MKTTLDNTGIYEEQAKSCSAANLASSIYSAAAGAGVFLVVDKHFNSIYTELVSNIPHMGKFVIDASEGNKTLATATEVFEELMACGANRKDVIVCIGGGIIGDLGGFVASTFMRGMRLFHVPTTLLAMVDSSIGGKTGLNFKGIKNYIGSFYRAEIIFQVDEFLDTLPKVELLCGIAEIIKIAAIKDEVLFQDLEGIDALERASLSPVISRAQALKKGFVAADKSDYGVRNALNFGHSLAHAIEAQPMQNRIPHGMAVAIGMAQVMKISAKKGYSDLASKDRLIALLKKYELPTELSFEVGDLIEYIQKDKKQGFGRYRIVTCPHIGEYRIIELSSVELREFFCEDCSG